MKKEVLAAVIRCVQQHLRAQTAQRRLPEYQQLLKQELAKLPPLRKQQ